MTAAERNEVLEQAAKVCESLRDRPEDETRSDDDDTRAELNWQCDACAKAIRAMKAPSDGDVGGS